MAHLAERQIRAAQPRARQYLIFDDDCKGFALCVYPTGRRAFVLVYRMAGRLRRYTIGAWPDWSAVAARDEARALKRDLDRGLDPLDRRRDARDAPLIRDLIDRYKREHLPRLAPRNAADQKSMLGKLVAPAWANRAVADISPADVEALLDRIALGRARPAKASAKSRRRQLAPARPTPIRANRVGEVLRKMFNLAIAWGMRADNPAKSFAKRMETPRERFLSEQEIQRLAAANSAARDQRAAGIIALCMLTGARIGEVREARFDEFNLDLGIWVKPPAKTKQRRIHRVPISPEAAALVRLRRQAVGDDCPWLFPSDAGDKPVGEIRGYWAALCRDAGLEGVRIHDLRHTVASLLINGGLSLEMIGKVLGHSQMRTTQRYAHLADSPLRAGLNDIGGMLRPSLRIVHNTPGEEGGSR